MEYELPTPKDCLYCDGYKYKCPRYSPLGDDSKTTHDYSDPELCTYYKVVTHDLDKIKDNRKDLTFEDLERIIRGDKQ